MEIMLDAREYWLYWLPPASADCTGGTPPNEGKAVLIAAAQPACRSAAVPPNWAPKMLWPPRPRGEGAAWKEAAWKVAGVSLTCWLGSGR